MGHTLAVAVVAALSLLLLHACPCAAARPTPTRPASSETSLLAVPPTSAAEGAQWRSADAAARAGKWLPYPYASGSVHHYPGYPRYYTGYPEGKPMMWAAGAPPSLLGAYGGKLGQFGKSASPYVDETRQEQVAMWASLLNPQRPTTPTSWLPASGGDEPADQARDEPKALDGAAEGTEMDLPPGGGGNQTGGQPKWGLYPGNNNGK